MKRKIVMVVALAAAVAEAVELNRAERALSGLYEVSESMTIDANMESDRLDGSALAVLEGQVAVLNISKGATLTLLGRHASPGGAADGGSDPTYDDDTKAYTVDVQPKAGAGGAGAGAGLRIEPGATLIVTGGGRLVAIGGNGGAGGAGCP